ncbi:MAG: IclR family transcriptional regulator [Candidatus Methylomirabilales bacterium]|nr:IclR family transcriptional regulator [candidate division NC10 bacterium]
MAHRRKEKSEYVVQSVDRALDILEAFNYQEEELGVTELSQKLGLHKNNVFRLLATLECRGYIEQDKRTGNYRLGMKTFEVANIFLHHLGLRRQARPVLEEMVNRCDETAYLGILDGPEVVYVLMHETSQTVRIVPRLGHRLPAYCTASGKIQLAYESRDHLAQIFEGHPLKSLTANTVDNLDKLVTHLKEVARLGYAVDDEELEEGVRCVAAPVKDYSHRVVAGVGLSGPVSRFSMERVEKELVPLVKEAAAKISQRLGYEVHSPVPQVMEERR